MKGAGFDEGMCSVFVCLLSCFCECLFLHNVQGQDPQPVAYRASPDTHEQTKV